MKKKAVLFDLDGTLLPMDQDEFVRIYFGSLARKLKPLGYETDRFLAMMKKGVMAMITNNGAVTNEERFLEVFVSCMGRERLSDIPVFEDFYRHEFCEGRAACKENPDAALAVQTAASKADKVILATNPLFPPCAVEMRMSWVGLKPENFALVTTYDTDCYCKPNPAYYTDILRRMNLRPEECVMIGNDENEDMWAASQAGIEGFLVTDCLIACPEHPCAGPRGDFKEMIGWICQLG